MSSPLVTLPGTSSGTATYWSTMAWGLQDKKARDKAFTRHVHQIYARIASKDHVTASVMVGSGPEQNITMTWEMSLAAYHHELDVLREDWALEIFGRWHLLDSYHRDLRCPSPSPDVALL